MNHSHIWLLSVLFACSPDKPITDTGQNDTGQSDTGQSDSGESDTSDSGTSDTADPTTSECAGEEAGRRLLRRLTRDEFEQTVRVVFDLDETQWAASDLPPDSAAENGFSNNADRLSVSSSFATGIAAAAKEAGIAISTEPAP